MKDTLQFKINATELQAFQLLQPKSAFDPNTIEFKIQLEHKMDTKQSLLAVICSINLMSNKDLLGSITVNCLYWVEDLDKISTLKKNKKQLGFLIDAVNAISISTTRGFLAATTRGTFLQTVILPIIDPRQLKTQLETEF